MYLRRKCYSFKDLLTENKEDYRSEGANLGFLAGSLGALGAFKLGVKHADDAYNAVTTSKGLELSESEEKNLEKWKKKLDKLPEKQKAKIKDYAKQKAEEAYKKVAETSGSYFTNRIPVTQAKRDIAEYITKELVRKDLLIGAGLSTAGVIGLTTAGYQLGKRKKK